MKNEKDKCPKCGEKLDHIYYKSLKWNIPDDRKGRGLCPHCQQGCTTFDVHIYHNDLEQRRYPQTDEQKYGVCCACGKRGNLWLWNEPPSPENKPQAPPSPEEIRKHREHLREFYADSTPQERAFAAAVLGKNPFDDEEESESDELFSDDDLVFSYSRKQAIEDGVLVDVSYLAKQHGFVYPVAMTRTLFEEYIQPDSIAKNKGETVMGRLNDLLTVLRVTAKRIEHQDPSIVFFTVRFTVHGRPRNVKLKSICGPGDTLEPVVTIMLPDED